MTRDETDLPYLTPDAARNRGGGHGRHGGTVDVHDGGDSHPVDCQCGSRVEPAETSGAVSRLGALAGVPRQPVV